MAIQSNFNPQDDFQHPVGEHPAWNESYYFFWSDTESELGAFMRIGIKGNEGNIESLLGLYLGGARIGFHHTRLPINRDHTELSAGGLSFVRKEPMKRWNLLFNGELQDIPDGKILETPRRDRLPGWHTMSRLEMDIDFEAISPPLNHLSSGNQGGQAHYEHYGQASGTVKIAGIDARVTGYGCRDHSWGPRTWSLQAHNIPQVPGKPMTTYKWLGATFGPDLAFAVTCIADEQGVHRSLSGLIRIGDMDKELTDVVITSEYLPGTIMHKSMHLVGKVDGKKFEVFGEVVNHIPTKRPMPDGTTTFITEGLTRFRTPEGRQALGIAEYWVKVPSRKRPE